MCATRRSRVRLGERKRRQELKTRSNRSIWQSTLAAISVRLSNSIIVHSLTLLAFGFFNAYGNVAKKDSVDYVLHLGDYIYEYANRVYGDGESIGRVSEPNKTIYSLYDYRRRHATYRTDGGLLSSHQNFAWIPVWDDHGKWRTGCSSTKLTGSRGFGQHVQGWSIRIEQHRSLIHSGWRFQRGSAEDERSPSVFRVDANSAS